MPPAPRGILFDKDGTLLDYHETWMPANRAAAVAMADGDQDLADRLLQLGGWDPSSGRIAGGTMLAAGSNDEIVAHWRPHLATHWQRPIPDLSAILNDIFSQHVVPTPVCDLGALLTDLEMRSLALGVATADSAQGLELSLRPFDILHRFVFAVGFDSGHGCKPDPGMVMGFCAATGLAPQDVWVVGDNRHEMEMAGASGAIGIGVLTGTSGREDLEQAGAVLVLDSVADLPSVIADQI